MTGSPLKKFVLTPILLSAAVFSALTLPLAVFGSKPVSIQLQEEPVFSGQLRDVATPYLGLATALSLGTGIASIAVTGWRQSSRQSSQAEAQLSDLAQNLKEKEELLATLQLSQSQLQTSGLGAFLDEQATIEPVNQTKTDNGNQPVVEPLVITPQPVEVQRAVTSQGTVQVAASQSASVQTVPNYAQPHTATKASPQVVSLAPAEVEELNSQLQQLMAQMLSLQTALAATAPEVEAEAQVAPAHSTKTWSLYQQLVS